MARRRRASKEPDDGDGGWLRPREMGLFKDVDPVYGEQHQAAHAASVVKAA
jgi:hypothetical protein